MNLQNAYFSFLGGDGRTPWVRACLEKAGCQVVEISNPKLTHMILPLPAFAANGSITGGEPLAELVARLHPGITLLGGKLEPWRDRLESTGAVVLDYFQDELLTAANAAVTAEGAVLLAMEQLPVTLAGTPVLVTGWGRIGQLLHQTARGHQVLCITHTPQVAAFADNQLLIQKNVRKDRTFTEIHTLDMDGRVEVLARMISGDKVSELSLASARELIEKSK